jgi:hypothetical protein
MTTSERAAWRDGRRRWLAEVVFRDDPRVIA